MKKIEKAKSKKALPKFKSVTLDREKLGQVTGGFSAECTGGTVSSCHIDGTDDNDPLTIPY